MLGSLNSVCPASLYLTLEACQDAALSLGLQWKGTETASDYPKGCYQFGAGDVDDGVRFNMHNIGFDIVVVSLL